MNYINRFDKELRYILHHDTTYRLDWLNCYRFHAMDDQFVYIQKRILAETPRPIIFTRKKCRAGIRNQNPQLKSITTLTETNRSRSTEKIPNDEGFPHNLSLQIVKPTWIQWLQLEAMQHTTQWNVNCDLSYYTLYREAGHIPILSQIVACEYLENASRSSSSFIPVL